jgi:hypothetical protein
LLEISKLIPKLVRNFEFEFADGLREKVERGEGWETTNRWFVKQVGFRVRISLRKGMKN